MWQLIFFFAAGRQAGRIEFSHCPGSPSMNAMATLMVSGCSIIFWMDKFSINCRATWAARWRLDASHLGLFVCVFVCFFFFWGGGYVINAMVLTNGAKGSNKREISQCRRLHFMHVGQREMKGRRRPIIVMLFLYKLYTIKTLLLYKFIWIVIF